jgi:hypothetical protein
VTLPPLCLLLLCPAVAGYVANSGRNPAGFRDPAEYPVKNTGMTFRKTSGTPLLLFVKSNFATSQRYRNLFYLNKSIFFPPEFSQSLKCDVGEEPAISHQSNACFSTPENKISCNHNREGGHPSHRCWRSSPSSIALDAFV